MYTRVSITGLLIVCLAVWRITHLLWGEDGPGDIFLRLRRRAGVSFIGRLLDCFYCLSLWFALPFALWLGESWSERFVLWLSFSGGAILLERATAQSSTPTPPAAHWTETLTDSQSQPERQEDHSHVMLR